MYELMVTRDGALPVTMKVFPSMQELTRTENRLDFAPKTVRKQQTIEFDRKRRPVPEGMTAHMVMIGEKEIGRAACREREKRIEKARSLEKKEIKEYIEQIDGVEEKYAKH